MLHYAGHAAGNEVPVTGAFGGVGFTTLQLAKRSGARVMALTSAANDGSVSDIGADRVVMGGEDLAGVSATIELTPLSTMSPETGSRQC